MTLKVNVVFFLSETNITDSFAVKYWGEFSGPYQNTVLRTAVILESKWE